MHHLDWWLGDQQWLELMSILDEHKDMAVVQELRSVGLLQLGKNRTGQRRWFGRT